MEIRMGIYLNPGNEEFQKALNSKIYVDKTMLISEMNRNLNTEHQNICVSRPRRFGKSMTANMLVAYYSKDAIPKACLLIIRLHRMRVLRQI